MRPLMSRLAATLALVCASTPAWAQAPAPCRLESIGSASVTAVRDGRTLLLGDGREVRLAGVELPADGSAQSALEQLTLNRSVTLRTPGAMEDRYGRAVAYVFTGEAGDLSVQHALLSAGRARVSARTGGHACAGGLLTHERAARQAKLGLWADVNYAPRQSDNPASVLAERGRFTLVEGKVVSVREVGGLIYVNFGRYYTRDFTVTILKRNERTFTAAGIEPKKLEGRRVRVRGYVEQRGGPVVEATRPEQIEIAELN